MGYKEYIKKVFLLISFLLFGIGSFNLFMDSFWTFNHSHRFNRLQAGSNERQQKTNMVYFRDFDYDSVLLGSSRITYFNQNDFKNMKVFNYSVSIMMPQEYSAYIEFAKKRRGKDFKNIIIGLDFFGSNKNYHTPDNLASDKIIDNTTSFGYRYKILFSIDVLRNSINNLYRSLFNKISYRSYNRYNVALTQNWTEEEVEKRVKAINLDNAIAMQNYEYDENLIHTLSLLKEKNPNSKFIVFATPVSSYYYNLLMDNGMKKDYEKWLKDIKTVFPNMKNFMVLDSLTINYTKNFIDYHHLRPKVCKQVIDKILDD